MPSARPISILIKEHAGEFEATFHFQGTWNVLEQVYPQLIKAIELGAVHAIPWFLLSKYFAENVQTVFGDRVIFVEALVGNCLQFLFQSIWIMPVDSLKVRFCSSSRKMMALSIFPTD